jgi:hypothetical protein
MEEGKNSRDSYHNAQSIRRTGISRTGMFLLNNSAKPAYMSFIFPSVIRPSNFMECASLLALCCSNLHHSKIGLAATETNFFLIMLQLKR